MENSIIRTIANRHSCRDFVGGEIPDDDMNVLLEAMRWAPSAGNLQPWFFYIVKKKDAKSALVKAAYDQKFIADAAAIFVICAIPSISAKIYGKRGSELYCLQDAAAAAENLLLAAEALGYGACWVGAFDEEMACKALKLDSEKRPVAIVPVGQGIKRAKHTARYELREICKTIG